MVRDKFMHCRQNGNTRIERLGDFQLNCVNDEILSVPDNGQIWGADRMLGIRATREAMTKARVHIKGLCWCLVMRFEACRIRFNQQSSGFLNCRSQVS